MGNEIGKALKGDEGGASADECPASHDLTVRQRESSIQVEISILYVVGLLKRFEYVLKQFHYRRFSDKYQ